MAPPISPHVSEYMTSGPFAVGPHEPLVAARHLMEKHGLRHLPVLLDDALVGIVSGRDLDLVQTLAHAPAEAITVEDAMTPAPYAPSPDTPLVEVVRVMIERKIGSAVVVDAGRIVGIFTATDAMRALTDVLAGQLVSPLGRAVTPPSPSTGSTGTRPRRRAARPG
jgi:acetoin utilization protein AcuB